MVYCSVFLPIPAKLRRFFFCFYRQDLFCARENSGSFRNEAVSGKTQEILAGFRAFLTRKAAAAGEKDGPEAGTCDLSNPPRPYLFYYSIPRRKRGERKREIQKEFTKDGTDRRYTPRNHVSWHNSYFSGTFAGGKLPPSLWKTRLKMWKTTFNRSVLSTEHKNM